MRLLFVVRSMRLFFGANAYRLSREVGGILCLVYDTHVVLPQPFNDSAVLNGLADLGHSSFRKWVVRISMRIPAQYRIGHYQDALDALQRCEKIRRKPSATDVAFMAIALYKLGPTDEARTELERLRIVMKDPSQSANPDSRDSCARWKP